METKHNVDDQKLSPDGSSELPTQQELYRSMCCAKHLSLAPQPCWAPQWFHREQTLLVPLPCSELRTEPEPSPFSASHSSLLPV